MLNPQMEVKLTDLPNQKKNIYEVVSLFSGVGGLDLGFLMLGDELSNTTFNIMWANDLEMAVCENYAHNFGVSIYTDPNQHNTNPRIFCGDVKEIEFGLAVDEDEVDVVVAGPPCKDFSILRGGEEHNRKGICVQRGQLYLQFVRALIELQPKVFVMENVQGLVSANDGLAYEQIINDFKHLNGEWVNDIPEFGSLNISNKSKYSVIFSEVINFSGLGVPQNRKRLIIIGIRSDIAKNLKKREQYYDVKRRITKLLIPQNLLSKYPLTPIEVFEGKPLSKLHTKYSKVMEDYSTLFNGDSKEWSSRKKEYYKKVWKKLTFDIKQDFAQLHNLPLTQGWFGGKSMWDQIISAHESILSELGYYGIPIDDAELSDGSQVRMPEKTKTMLRMRQIAPYENHTFVKGARYGLERGMMSGYWRRIHPLIPSPTIIGAGGGGTWGYSYEMKKYRLTTRERARLQTFPDWFVFRGSHTDTRKQLGNAVPPLASKIIASAVYSILSVLC